MSSSNTSSNTSTKTRRKSSSTKSPPKLPNKSHRKSPPKSPPKSQTISAADVKLLNKLYKTITNMADKHSKAINNNKLYKAKYSNALLLADSSSNTKLRKSIKYPVNSQPASDYLTSKYSHMPLHPSLPQSVAAYGGARYKKEQQTKKKGPTKTPNPNKPQPRKVPPKKQTKTSNPKTTPPIHPGTEYRPVNPTEALSTIRSEHRIKPMNTDNNNPYMQPAQYIHTNDIVEDFALFLNTNVIDNLDVYHQLLKFNNVQFASNHISRLNTTRFTLEEIILYQFLFSTYFMLFTLDHIMEIKNNVVNFKYYKAQLPSITRSINITDKVILFDYANYKGYLKRNHHKADSDIESIIIKFFMKYPNYIFICINPSQYEYIKFNANYIIFGQSGLISNLISKNATMQYGADQIKIDKFYKKSSYGGPHNVYLGINSTDDIILFYLYHLLSSFGLTCGVFSHDRFKEFGVSANINRFYIDYARSSLPSNNLIELTDTIRRSIPNFNEKYWEYVYNL